MAGDLGGKAKHLGGKIKEGVGEALGDRELERKGRLDQVEGEADQDESRAERDLEEARARKDAARDAKRGPARR